MQYKNIYFSNDNALLSLYVKLTFCLNHRLHIIFKQTEHLNMVLAYSSACKKLWKYSVSN